ncbi:MAG TPA: putative sulfate exporter family transporter [Gaiellaceae bacterium]|nr:putative sulfate exporter family transporter [Gaiellaceae bacterium]
MEIARPLSLPRSGDKHVASILPGLAAALAVAAVAWPLGRALPMLGAPVVALALGIAVAAVRRPGVRTAPGLAFSGRYVLQAAIVALGGTLSLGQVASVGRSTVPVMVGTLAIALAVAAVAGRLLGVPGRLRALVGVGTGICGASAIGAVSGIVRATEAEIAYAVSTIFVFNLVAVVLFPPLGHLLGLDQSAFGLWAGTAVNDTSSVVAAAYAYGDAAGVQAVIVKLTRTTMIVPIAAALAFAVARLGGGSQGVRWTKTVPWFLVWFAAAAALETAGAVPAAAADGLRQLAIVLTAVALGAIGLSTRLGELRRAGARPLLLGTLVWASVAVGSLVLQRLSGAW